MKIEEPVVVPDPFATPPPREVPQQQGESGSQSPATVSPGPMTQLPPQVPARSPRAGAGLSLLLACTGATVGTAVGGLWGGLSGVLLAGALRNSMRAATNWTSENPEQSQEARKSATVALLGWFLGGVSAYQANQACNKAGGE